MLEAITHSLNHLQMFNSLYYIMSLVIFLNNQQASKHAMIISFDTFSRLKDLDFSPFP
jgi:hypothetical protein